MDMAGRYTCLEFDPTAPRIGAQKGIGILDSSKAVMDATAKNRCSAGPATMEMCRLEMRLPVACLFSQK
jgi:hypothetical protein